MKDHSELKRLAEATKGWDNLKSCWPEETVDGDLEVNWFVGGVSDDDDKYPVIEVNTAQYDAFEDAGHLARFYASANPAAVLALIAEVEGLRKLPTAWSEVYEQSDELDALRDEKLAWLSERDQLKADNDLQSKEIEAMRKAVEFGADCFRKISSGDGSGHADLAESILRIAGSTISKVHNK